MTAERAGVSQFAFALYRSGGVRTACLSLQDRRGADVNVVLVAAYVGAALRHGLTQQQAQAMRRRCAAWQTDVVAPLRAVRRRLREGPPPAPGASTDRLRDDVQQIELRAECIELDDLALLVAGWEIVPRLAQTPVVLAVSSITAVLADGVGPLLDDDLAAVRVIAEAASVLEVPTKS